MVLLRQKVKQKPRLDDKTRVNQQPDLIPQEAVQEVAEVLDWDQALFNQNLDCDGEDADRASSDTTIVGEHVLDLGDQVHVDFTLECIVDQLEQLLIREKLRK